MQGIPWKARKGVWCVLVWGVLVGLQTAAGSEAPAWQLDMAYVRGGTFQLGSLESDTGILSTNQAVASFWMGRHEVTVEEFSNYLNETGDPGFRSCPDLSFRGGRYRPKWFCARRPVSGVSRSEAQAYCHWLARKTGQPVRLPTEAEWEYAARGGLAKARFPWGWGEPSGRACFREDSARRVGRYAANPFGLYDLAGNVYEWCLAEGEPRPGQALARGGSWSERDPRYLRVFHRTWFPDPYRDADVGFRVVIPEAGEQKAYNLRETP